MSTKMHGSIDQHLSDTLTADESSRLPRRSRKVENETRKPPDAIEPVGSGARWVGWPFARVSEEARQRSAEIESYKRDNQRLHSHVEQQYITIQNLRIALDEAAENIKNHERRHAVAQRAHNERIDKHMRECQQEIQTLQEQVYNLEVDRAPGKALANKSKVSDTAVLDIWKGMAYNICSLANTLLTYCPPQEELEAGHSQNADTVLHTTPAEYDLLSEEKTRSAVVEHYIWRSVFNGVFGSHQKERLGAWGGSMGTRLHFLCYAFLSKVTHDNVADFCLWKSDGATLIEAAMGLQDRVLQQHVAREQLKLSVLLPLDKRKDRSIRNRLHRDLLSVFGDALELYSVFMKSRAFFRVHWINPFQDTRESFTYDPNAMEAEVWGSRLDTPQRILLTISPALSKTGTADGSDYDRTSLLVKPRVVCG